MLTTWEEGLVFTEDNNSQATKTYAEHIKNTTQLELIAVACGQQSHLRCVIYPLHNRQSEKINEGVKQRL